MHHSMDPKHSSEMFKHLEKQQEILMEAYRTLSLELHKLQVEEEMLMHKFYEFMSVQGLVKKGKKREDLPNEDAGENEEDLCNKDSITHQSQ